MKILGIETSCDETSAAIIEAKENANVTLLSNIVASSLSLHAKTGGIIPEVAAREQIKYIIPVIQQALKEAYGFPFDTIDTSLASDTFPIDAIAVTVGPGLIGSLLVGVETAKTLAYVWKKPLIPVNHLLGHIYANWITKKKVSKEEIKAFDTFDTPRFPCIALIVSGGHTDLVLMNNHGNIKWLGGTRDDAAGEALDKIGRLLNLPYPGGPIIEQLAQKGNPKAFHFPRPIIGSDDFDFSFSGLKTAVLREVKKNGSTMNYEPLTINNLCASVQQAITDVLIKKTIKAAQKYNVKSILLCGGVAANQALKKAFELNARRHNLNAEIFVPQKSLCTDNAAMIASAAFYNYKEVSVFEVTANPELYFD